MGATKTTLTSSSLVTLTVWRGKWRNKQMRTFWAYERAERGHLSLVSRKSASCCGRWELGATARSYLSTEQVKPRVSMLCSFLLSLRLLPLASLFFGHLFFLFDFLLVLYRPSPSTHPRTFKPQETLTQIRETYIRYNRYLPNDVISCLFAASGVSWTCLRGCFPLQTQLSEREAEIRGNPERSE